MWEAGPVLYAQLVAVDWATKTTAISSIVLAGAALFALESLSDAKKTRHGQIVADLSRRWDDRVVLESVELFRVWAAGGAIKLIDTLWGKDFKEPTSEKEREKYTKDLATWYQLSIYPNLIETIGVFVERDVITDEVVYMMWGPPIDAAWKEWRQPVKHLRQVTDDDSVWQWFEDIGLKMSSRAAQARADAETRRTLVRS
jgi:hypothetical protein